MTGEGNTYLHPNLLVDTSDAVLSQALLVRSSSIFPGIHSSGDSYPTKAAKKAWVFFLQERSFWEGDKQSLFWKSKCASDSALNFPGSRGPATLASPDALCQIPPFLSMVFCLGLGLAHCPLATLHLSGAVEQALAMAWLPDRQKIFFFIKLKFQHV